MNIKYQGEEYKLVNEVSDLDSICLLFAKREEYGVKLLSMRYRMYRSVENDMSVDWMYLPYMTIEDIAKDHYRQVAL